MIASRIFSMIAEFAFVSGMVEFWSEVEIGTTVETIVAQLGLTLAPAVYAEVVELALAEAYAEVYAE